MVCDRVTLREKHDADRTSRQRNQSQRDRLAGYIPSGADNSDDSKDIPPDNADADFLPDLKALTTTSSQNNTNSPTLTAACYQYLINDYVGASNVTGALTRYGIITEEDTNRVIGPHK